MKKHFIGATYELTAENMNGLIEQVEQLTELVNELQETNRDLRKSNQELIRCNDILQWRIEGLEK